jgi:hypothetical protein
VAEKWDNLLNVKGMMPQWLGGEKVVKSLNVKEKVPFFGRMCCVGIQDVSISASGG